MTVDYKQLYEQMLDRCAEQEATLALLRKESRLLKLRDVPLPNSGYEWLTYLQYKAKSLRERVRAFETGEKYVSMKAEFKAQLAGKDREILRLKAETADANARTVTVRNYWAQIFDDLEKEHRKELAGKDREIKAMEARALRAEKQRDDGKDKITELYRELYQVKTELEEEQGKNLKLKAQINRDYENSSIPSSMKPNRKKITNNREKSGKKPGGQPGHEWHPRKRQEPTDIIEIPAPDKYADSPDYKPTGKTVTKQMVDIRLELVVSEYRTPEFRDRRTGQRVHADFPDGVTDDVNYSGNIKSFLFLLNNYCNVSVAKASGFLSELTGGKLSISAGMINGLSKEFSTKTEADYGKAFNDILNSPAVNVDFTTGRVNGKQANVMVCATPQVVLYFAREHKGHKGIKGTPVEVYYGILIHDHDKTFYKYGCGHQECLEHVRRYLKDSIANESGLKWNKRMRKLVQKMMRFWNGLDPGDLRNPDEICPDRVSAFEAEYDEILALAKEEYEYEPPSKYYMDGFNLYKRMRDYRDNHLLFLHDRRVPPTNNLSERLLRVFKRKQRQVMAFRSWGGMDNLCGSLGPIAMIRADEKNLYESVASIFNMVLNGEERISA